LVLKRTPVNHFVKVESFAREEVAQPVVLPEATG
jgi:hypothetical protein